MYLCFIDESGSPPTRQTKSPRPYFVIAGVIMHETQWHGVAEDLRRLRAKPEFNVTGEIKWRFFGNENNDRHNAVRHLPPAARDSFRAQFFEIITRRKSVRIICCVTRIEDAYRQSHVAGPEDIYHRTYAAVTERFQYFLRDVGRRCGDKQIGIVVSDHRGKNQDDLLRSAHHGFVDEDDTFTSKHPNFVETVFLTPSHRSVGIQFADMVAGAVGRAYNSGDPRYARQIRGSFRCDASGAIGGYGLAKFPAGWQWVPPGGGQAP